MPGDPRQINRQHRLRQRGLPPTTAILATPNYRVAADLGKDKDYALRGR
jgi:hypothetical protein